MSHKLSIFKSWIVCCNIDKIEMSLDCWESAEGAQIAYIFGIASHEGSVDARAGFGIDWGPNNSWSSSWSKGGSAIKDKTELRAELTAVLTVLKTAHGNQLPATIIRHTSENLERVLKSWFDSSDNSKRLIENSDLLNEIEELASIMPVKIEKSRIASVFLNATLHARRVVGMHSTSFAPLTDENHERGYRIVDIYGACNDGQPNARAGYGVFWGDEDVRNENGTVPGPQSSYRAVLTALYQALSMALSTNHDEIVIRSRCANVHKCIENHQMPSDAHADIRDRLISILPRFEKVLHWMPPKMKKVEGLEKAEVLAKRISGNNHAHVSIAGFETSDDGIARYGIYWKTGDNRNGKGYIEGKHGQLCAEMTALGIAVKHGLEGYEQHLTVYTDSELLKEFLINWRRLWRDKNWPLSRGKVIECMENCNSLRLTLDKITVAVKSDGVCDFIREAKDLALSVKAFTNVRTFGSIQSGNNEPVARYGVHWISDPNKNEYGFVDGSQTTTKAKQVAIRRALEIAIHEQVTKLVIQSDLSETEQIDEKLERDIKLLEMQFEVVRYETHSSDEFDRILETM